MWPTAKGVPRMLNVNREPHRPKKRKKITVVFDEKKRKEYLTGFHKRKLERREKSRAALLEKLKVEKKRITEEAKAKFKSYLSQRDVPELEELLSKHEYETNGQNISILELNVNQLKQSSNWIGENKPHYEEEESEEEMSTEENEEELIPGMELKERKKKNPIQKEEEDDQPQMSKKEMSRAIQKETLKKTHSSKLFKRKQRRDCRKNRKSLEREKKKKEALLKKAKGKTKIKLMRQMNNNK